MDTGGPFLGVERIGAGGGRVAVDLSPPFSGGRLKFFILIHVLNSSTCFEHYYAHCQEDNEHSIWYRHSLWVTVQYTGYERSSRNLRTEQSPKDSDDTRCCTNTIVLLNMSIIVLETCRGM